MTMIRCYNNCVMDKIIDLLERKFEMEKQVEYEAIREEILSSMQVVKSYRTLLYTIVESVI